MAIAKIEGAQRDFSAGEVDVTMKRADENPLMKAGARQLSNWRILNSKAVQNRPGRRALFLASNRTDELVVAGQVFYFNFTPVSLATINVFNSVGALIFTQVVAGSTFNSIPLITLAVIGNAVYFAGPNIVPFILTWSGTAWSYAQFAEAIFGGGQKRTPFYRISPQNITLLPSATTGSITITFSSAVLVAGMVGTRLRFCGRQMLITAVSSSTVGTAVVIEPLPPAQQLTLSNNVGIFNVGDNVQGATSGAAGIVTVNTLSAGGQQVVTLNTPIQFTRVGDQFTGGTSGATGQLISISPITLSLNTSTLFQNGEVITDNTQGGTWTITSISGGGATAQLIVQLIQTSGIVKTFTASEIVVAPSGSATTSGIATKTPQAVAIWDDEVMNSFRGWPAACFADQNRLGFCDFPSVPTGIAWSGIGTPADFYPGALPGQPMFELAPRNVLYVVPGMESSEFVLCDTAIYYIPITITNPLKPGSVAFNQLSQQGAAQVVPRTAEQTIIYVKAGSTQIGAIQVPGAYYRPYVVDNISEMHAHLFNGVVAIAIPSGSTQFEETYLYVLNGDGTIAVGKYLMKNGLLDAGPDGKPHVGWAPWSGGGTVTWVAANGSDMLFTTSYAGAASIVEVLDNKQYLDGALLVNSLPTPFAAPAGKGPLFNFPGPSTSFTLIDQGYRMMGTYQTDANGFIIPQNNGGENLAAATLTAGYPWTATLEPFVPDAAPGQDVHQRMFPRRVSRMAAYVSQSTGFLMARLFSGRITRTSPPLGTIMNFRRFTAWNQDDDPTLPPPLREEAQRWRPLGRSFDPRMAIVKDTPGSIIVHEIGMEASI